MKLLAKNDLVELTWWDEYDSKDVVEISFLTEYDDGSGEKYIQVDDFCLSVSVWDALCTELKYIIKHPEIFIEKHKVSHET